MRTDHPRAWTQRREAAVAPFLTGVGPALHWRVEAAGWDLLGFEALDGHHADYSPASPDLPTYRKSPPSWAVSVERPARTSNCGTPSNALSATPPAPATSASSGETTSCTPI
ncbi:hypothetical protein TPA0598_05_03990 [Streptomyces lydicamycinicus]|uniref:Uncharacterized protein n=1 Tax=Streptomyces lydicamycinicus TaxID=1546107 RepID=A0A0P4R9I8_9ACTN|nr:hypothetical protein TPA0598_05_03990 [Streptomyces lydicamycinicus]